MAPRPRPITQTPNRLLALLLMVGCAATVPVLRAQSPRPQSPETAPSAPAQTPPPADPSTSDQQPPAQPPATPATPPADYSPSPIEAQTVVNPFAPCVQPPPPVSYSDYKGPFAKTISVYARRLERRSAGLPGSSSRYKADTVLCTLKTKEKFWLFVNDSTDPVAFINAAFNASIDQAEDNQHTFGRDATSYLDRFGSEMAGQASSNFFKDFLYPTIFSEDPRYYRLGRFSTKRRIFHAMSHVVIAYNVNGNTMFNFSEWLGNASVIVLSNTYLPDNRRGVGPVAENMAIAMGYDMAYDILREFWPEIAHTFHLPFRDQPLPAVVVPPAKTTTTPGWP